VLSASGSDQAHTLSGPAPWALTMGRPLFLTTRHRPLIAFFLHFFPPMLGGFEFSALMTLRRGRRPEVSTRLPLDFLAGLEPLLLSSTHRMSSAGCMSNLRILHF
jgi:hypothetical protein